MAITDISHGYSLFTRGVTGGMPVIMASTWNYLSGRRQLLPVSAIFIVCPGIARRPAGDHGTNLKLSTREPIPVMATIIACLRGQWQAVCRSSWCQPGIICQMPVADTGISHGHRFLTGECPAACRSSWCQPGIIYQLPVADTGISHGHRFLPGK